MRTANPALNDKSFENIRPSTTDSEMSLSGTVNKTVVLLAILMCAAAFTWEEAVNHPDSVMTWAMIGAIGGFVVALITVFKKHYAPISAPIYAVLEGLFLGVVSAMFEQMYPGIVVQAVTLTFGTLFALLLAYRSGLIKATENFKLGVVAATGSVFFFYLGTWILRMFGVDTSFMMGSGLLSIGISAVVVVIAALNLVLDFDFIENGCEQGLPKYMEWYAAFGLMVTLVWLYIEILHLLSKLSSDD
jgi:uncharacterized YccA/Bax inhibitor family protein